MQINSITIPTTMTTNNFGYDFRPPEILGYNGQKSPITAGDASSLTLFYPRLNDEQWDWWVTTLLAGEDHAEFTQAQLYDNNKDLVTFDHCIVYRPIREKFEAGYHTNVTISIVDIF